MGNKMGAGASSKKERKDRSHLLQTCLEHEGSVNCMAVSEDGSILATGGEDKSARIWSSKTEQCECLGVLIGHEDYVNCILIEDNFVLSGSADATIRKWDMSTLECVLIFTGHNSSINRIICTGDFVFSSSYDRTARCWDFETGEVIRVFHGHKKGVYPLVFIPSDEDDEIQNDCDIYNKDILITGSQDATAKAWSFETGECVKTFKGHTGAIMCMASDTEGKTLFTGSADNTIRSWDIMKGTQTRVFEGHQASVISLVVANKLLYSASSDHTGRCWVIEFGDCTRIYKGHKHTVIGMKLHQGMVFTGCGDNVARCFDAKSGTLKRQFVGHQFAVTCLQVVESRLFTGSVDGTMRVWDAGGIKEDTIFSNQPDRSKSAPAAANTTHRGRSDGFDLNDSHTRMMIENEKLRNASFTGSLGAYDKRSDVDSGIDQEEDRERARAEREMMDLV